jgi:hypothetical protein
MVLDQHVLHSMLRLTKGTTMLNTCYCWVDGLIGASGLLLLDFHLL